jgi:hypothetical protein
VRQKTDQPRPIEQFSAEVERLGRACVIFEGQLFSDGQSEERCSCTGAFLGEIK